MFHVWRTRIAKVLLALLALAVVAAPVGAMAAPCAMDASPCVACPMHSDQPPVDADPDGKAAPALKSCGCLALLKAMAGPAVVVAPQRAMHFDAPAVLRVEAGVAPETEPRPPRSL